VPANAQLTRLQLAPSSPPKVPGRCRRSGSRARLSPNRRRSVHAGGHDGDDDPVLLGRRHDNFYLTGFSSGELGWDTGRSFLCTANIQPVLGCTLGTWTAAAPDGISGGFTSYNYAQPFYQAGIAPAPLALRNEAIVGPTPERVIPDISADADPGTGFLIGLHQTLPNRSSQYTQTRYGGTSLASPLLAGMVADADQAAVVPLGFINPVVYRLDVTQPATINDVLPEPSPEGNFRRDYAGATGLGFGVTGFAESFRELFYQGLETYCDTTGNCASRTEPLTTAPGYDSLTGLGSPGTNFITALAGRQP
jgi:hypothetical protein